MIGLKFVKGLHMRYAFLFLIGLIFAGCFSSPEPYDGVIYKPKNDKASKLMFERVLKIPLDCSPSDKSKGDVVIDGAKYTSKDALHNCLKRNLLDTSLTLKKVYIHRIIDARIDSNVLSYMSDEGLTTFYAPRFSLEELYYLFLQNELQSRGIVVLDEPSPASIRLDFDMRSLIGAYHPSNRILELGLGGKLNLNGYRVNRQRDIVSTAKIVNCGIGCDMDFFTSLLVKQAAIKSADEVSKIGR